MYRHIVSTERAIFTISASLAGRMSILVITVEFGVAHKLLS